MPSNDIVNRKGELSPDMSKRWEREPRPTPNVFLAGLSSLVQVMRRDFRAAREIAREQP